MRVLTFTVTGRGQFPVDMLRFDCCFPADPSAVAVITQGYNEKRVTVQLCAYLRAGDIAPTPERWASFGWAVDDVDTVEL